MFDSSFKMCDKTTWYRVPLDNWYIRPSLRRCNSSSGAIWWHDSRLHHLGLFMLFKQCIVTLAPSNTSFSRICPCTILNFFYYHQQHQHTYTHTVLRAPTIKKKHLIEWILWIAKSWGVYVPILRFCSQFITVFRVGYRPPRLGWDLQ